MNRRIARWLYRKAADVLGEEELESLKNDLVAPVKIAARDAVADFLNADGEREMQRDEEQEN